MVSGRETVQFVVASSVRSGVLAFLDESPASTDDVLEATEASTSAVYNALRDLESHGLVTASDSHSWELTGGGQLVADMVCQRERCEQLLCDIDEYLEGHDTSVLPRASRLRFGELEGSEVVNATDTEPHKAVEEVTGRIDESDSVRAISPIYVESYATAIPDVPESKLVVDEQVAIWAQETDDVADARYDHLEIRVADVDFALSVTDTKLLLSLPTLDGGYDAQSEVIAEHDRAREWGQDLFERYWERAVPVERFEQTLEVT